VQVFYECQRCGNCCRCPGFVHLTDEDTDRLAAHLNLSVADFAARYTELDPFRSHLVLKNRPNGECVFLEGINKCAVHPAKPVQCEGFPNKWNFPGWRDMCQAIPVEVNDAEKL